MKNKSLVIVSGASGKLGEIYLRSFSRQNFYKCIGISRRNPEKKLRDVSYLKIDLLNREQTKKKIKNLKIECYEKIWIIHCIGKFKFEINRKPEFDKNKDGIDDIIFDSNIKTFLNLFSSIKENISKNTNLEIIAFGSVSDKYNVPFWESYTQSKNILREILKKISLKEKIKCNFVNVSTTNTGNENLLRPFGDKKYWLSPREIVEESLKKISENKRRFFEFNIIKNNPSFKRNYYKSPNKILAKWLKEMGIEEKGGEKNETIISGLNTN